MDKTPAKADLRDWAWCERLLRATWWYILGVSLLEILIFVLKKANGTADNTGEYIVRYIVVPGVFNVSVMGLVHLLSRMYFSRNRFAAQGYAYLIGVSAICLGVAWIHRAVMLSRAAFLLPVVLSIVYGDKRKTRFTFAVNLAAYTLALLITCVRDPACAPNFMEVLTGYGLLLLSLPISGMIVDRHQELTNRLVAASELSMLDSLTKLYNHAAFYEQLDAHILKNARGEGAFCLIIFDIDEFKHINDRYGHDVGDEVLLMLVNAILSAIDMEKKDIAFRYGGEEFTVLTPRPPKATLALAEEIRADFAKRTREILPEVAVTVSAGVCQFEAKRFNGRREFFASADEALYEAKRTGKNKAILWTPELLERPARPISQSEGEKNHE